MTATERLAPEAQNLSIEERYALVDKILGSIRTVDPAIEEAWIDEAIRRDEAIDCGESTPIPHEEVMARIRSRFSIA